MLISRGIEAPRKARNDVRYYKRGVLAGIAADPGSSWILVAVAEETSTLQPAIPNRYVPLGARSSMSLLAKNKLFARAEKPPETVR